MSALLLWERAPGWCRVRPAVQILAVHGSQLAESATWPWLIFGLHLILVGLMEITTLLTLIVADFVLFRRIDRLAGGC